MTNFRVSHDPALHRYRGFTLIELMVTLMIMSVLMGFALPKLGNIIYSSDLKRSLRQLKAILFVARSQATADRVPRRIVCDIDKGEIRIQREVQEELEDVTMVEYEASSSVLIKTYRLPEGVEIEDVINEAGDKEIDGEAFLRIGSNGIIQGNIIHLRKGDDQYTLRINALTGRVTIEEGYIEEFKLESQSG